MDRPLGALTDDFGEVYGEIMDLLTPRVLPDPKQDPALEDMQALIDYVTTLSKIHGKRIAIFTVPDTKERERYTRCDFGFGQSAITIKGWGDDLHDREPEPEGMRE